MTTLTSHAPTPCTQAHTHGSLQQLMSAAWLKQATMAFTFSCSLTLRPIAAQHACMQAQTHWSEQRMSIVWPQPSP